MVSFSELIKTKLNDLGISVYKLSKLSGVSQPGLKAIIDGDSSPSFDTITKICEGLELSLSDFFSDDTTISSEEHKFLRLLHRANNQAQKSAYAVLKYGQPNDEKESDHYRNLIDDLEGLLIPVIGRAAAGTPIEMIREYDSALEVDDQTVRPGDIAVIADGDSMIDAGIMPGDRVIIHPQENVENGEIALVAIGDGSTIKYFYKTTNGIKLVPANEKYSPQEFTQDFNIRIIGKVVKVLDSFRERCNMEF